MITRLAGRIAHAGDSQPAMNPAVIQRGRARCGAGGGAEGRQQRGHSQEVQGEHHAQAVHGGEPHHPRGPAAGVDQPSGPRQQDHGRDAQRPAGRCVPGAPKHRGDGCAEHDGASGPGQPRGRPVGEDRHPGEGGPQDHPESARKDRDAASGAV
ncbi:MAG: hypothetical protein ABIO70_23015 [Pseudomonadota bacterium]